MATRDWAAAATIAGVMGLAYVFGPQVMNVWQISRLEPETRARAQALLDWLAAQGLKPRITATTRTETQQAAAVADGKSATSISWHFTGRALDLLLTNPITGKLMESPTNAEIEAYYRPAHRKWAELGGFGLAFGPYPDGPIRHISGTKGPIWDGGHFEYHGPFATAAAAYTASKNA
jgi:hypothetical protein